MGELLEEGKTKDAIAFRDYYRGFGPDAAKMLLDWAGVYQRYGRKELATAYLKKVLLLDPTNQEAAAKLKELEAGEKKGAGSRR